MERAKAFFLFLVGMSMAFACTTVSAVPLSDCVTQANIATLKHDFFTNLPNRSAFDAYVDRTKFKLHTNAMDGAALQREGKPVQQKIDWIIDIFNDHKGLFVNAEKIQATEFTYIKGQLRGREPSVDNIITSARFPKAECVYEVTFRTSGKACDLSQRLSNLSFTFVKDERGLLLSSVDMFFEACP